MKKVFATVALSATVLAGLLASSCLKTDFCPTAFNGGTKVCFFAAGSTTGNETKTSIASNGISTNWTPGDDAALWATRLSDGQEVIPGTRFTLSGKSGSKAQFSADLPSAMPQGRYSYSACYPYPESISPLGITFTLPAEQDGSGKQAILFSLPTEGGPLSGGKSPSESLCLKMEHICHILRLQLPDGEDPFEGEPIRSIILEFSSPVVGTVSTIASFNGKAKSRITTLTEGSSTITLNPASPLEKGNFVCAVIHPCAFTSTGTLKITAQTDSWRGTTAPISLSGRNFKAGHCTPVPIRIKERTANFSINFVLKENNFGEDLQKITIGDFEYCPGKDIPTGSVIKQMFDTEQEYLRQGSTSKTLILESEHVIWKGSVWIPDLSATRNATIQISAPYLLDENFDTVKSFSSDDAYVTASTGSKDAVSFLDGWTGARIGAKEGKCIRIAGRREAGLWIDAHYPARVESACLPVIKSPVDIELVFDYGTDCDGIDKYGQTVYVGYVTSKSAYKSSDTTGNYPETFSTNAMDGSYDSTPNSAAYTLPVPAGESIRISWRNDPEEHKDFASNTTSWLYIDNVKVRIKK